MPGSPRCVDVRDQAEAICGAVDGTARWTGWRCSRTQAWEEVDRVMRRDRASSGSSSTETSPRRRSRLVDLSRDQGDPRRGSRGGGDLPRHDPAARPSERRAAASGQSLGLERGLRADLPRPRRHPGRRPQPGQRRGRRWRTWATCCPGASTSRRASRARHHRKDPAAHGRLRRRRCAGKPRRRVARPEASSSRGGVRRESVTNEASCGQQGELQ